MEWPSAHIGHLVLLTSFIANSIASGMGYANSAFYYGPWMETFGSASWLTSLVGSLNIAAVCLVGPVAGAMINRLGFRTTVMIGSVVSVVGLAISSFANSIYLLLFFYFIAGVGWGLIYIPLCLAFSHYYDPKYHGLCAGIVTSGAGFGHFVTPPIVDKLTELYTWRGALLIQSGLAAHSLLLAFSLRPMPTMKVEKAMLKLTLFRNVGFLYTMAHMFLFTTAMSILFVHLSYSLETNAGVSRQYGAYAVSALGLSSLAGKLIHGILSKLKGVNPILQTMISVCLTGIGTVLIPFVTNYAIIIFICVVIGFGFGPYGSVMIIISLTVVGVDDAPSAYGYLNFMGGLGLFIGAPIAGAFYDMTSNYIVSMSLGGAVFICSGLVMIHLAATWHKRILMLTVETDCIDEDEKEREPLQEL